MELEKRSIEKDFEYEMKELAVIYEERGLEPLLAKKVAEQLMAHDALGAHMRDEIGISEIVSAQPIQAALFSAATFTIGGALPLLSAWAVIESQIILAVSCSSLLFLTLLGTLSAWAGGASMYIGAVRITFWGALAMVLTAGIGRLFGVAL